MLKKKMWKNFHRIRELFTQKYGFVVRDPRSGVQKAPEPGSRIRIRNNSKFIKFNFKSCSRYSALNDAVDVILVLLSVVEH